MTVYKLLSWCQTESHCKLYEVDGNKINEKSVMWYLGKSPKMHLILNCARSNQNSLKQPTGASISIKNITLIISQKNYKIYNILYFIHIYIKKCTMYTVHNRQPLRSCFSSSVASASYFIWTVLPYMGLACLVVDGL